MYQRTPLWAEFKREMFRSRGVRQKYQVADTAAETVALQMRDKKETQRVSEGKRCLTNEQGEQNEEKQQNITAAARGTTKLY